MAEVRAMLDSSSWSRLTGPGGAWARPAGAAAAPRSSCAGGVWLVELAGWPAPSGQWPSWCRRAGIKGRDLHASSVPSPT
ncbi:hypothetical protein [Nonomuraea dietziae]|uniref:hypothetical protein n=1 Tax=Nonomuraea dietziae TaxID=65515 RepID=UPI0031DE0A5F